VLEAARQHAQPVEWCKALRPGDFIQAALVSPGESFFKERQG
jgi:hypothetical protein